MIWSPWDQPPDSRTDRQSAEGQTRRIYGQVGRWDGRTVGWTVEPADGWSDGRTVGCKGPQEWERTNTNKRTIKQTSEQLNEQTNDTLETTHSL